MATQRRPMPVLYVHSSAQMYGADAALLQLVAGLDRERFLPIVVVPEAGVLVDALRGLDVETHVAPLTVIHRTGSPVYWGRTLLHLPPTVAWLSRLIRDRQVQIVHSNTSHVLDGALAARRIGAKHIWHVREPHTRRSLVGRALSMLVLRYSTRVLVVSNAARAAFFPAGTLGTPIETVYEGVDMRRFHPDNDGAAVRAELGVAAGTPVVGMAGRIAHWKGHAHFMAAAAQVLRQRPDVRFWIVGDAVTPGDRRLKERLLATQQELGLAEALAFTGLRRDMPNVMAALDVFVLPSQAPEPWGFVTLEAMATAKPVVATRHGGPLEMVQEGETGYLVSPDDPDELAERLVYLLDHPDTAAAMGQQARTLCAQKFAVERSCAEIMHWYDQTCGPTPNDTNG